MSSKLERTVSGAYPPPAGQDSAKVVKLSRAERNEATKRNLFEAARRVVGRHGYAEASVARITSEAGVAQGTFYNHFTNRQELLDQLLPSVGQDMVRFIRARTRSEGSEADKEADRIAAFFEFLKEVPEFLRILNEAEFFAPVGYQQHLDMIAATYSRLFKRAREKGEVGDFSDEELEALVHMFMGARGYLSRRYAYEAESVHAVPDHVLSAYAKLLGGGLFTKPGA